MRYTFEALGTPVEVSVDDDVPDADVVALLLAAYPATTRTPALAFRLRGGARPALVCAGRYETAVETAADLVPLFEVDLYHALVEQAAPGWLLHAAALERDGGAVVLAGPSGAGKTTLTLALLARGWRLSTEEIVLVDRGAIVTGLARPIHAHPAIPSEWTQRTHVMRSSRGALTARIAQPPAALRMTAPLPLRALARIGHASGIPPSLEVMPPAVALERLWACTLRQDDDGLAAATSLVGRHTAYALRSSSVAEAVMLVDRLTSD